MSADVVKQAMETQLKNLQEKTGITLEEWNTIIDQSGFQKHGEIVAYLKEKHGLGHGNANMLVHAAKQSAAGFSDEEQLLADQYKGKEDMKTWYDALLKEVHTFGNDIEVSPKKAYVSLRRKKQFAIIQPSTKTRMDIGLNIKEATPQGKLEKAGSWNTMCSHRIKIEAKTDVDSSVISWIKKAYDSAG